MGVSEVHLKPCPKCKGRILAQGMPYTISTPKVFRPLMRSVGVTCVRCGYWKHSIAAWNRGSKDAKTD